ncbi:hypothetical protein [Neobacillus sp. Marseille-QA0830]
MKILLVSVILAGGLLSFIMYLDILMGVEPSKLVLKALDPFRVIEPAELVIIFIFTGSFLMESLYTFIKKRKRKSANKN